MANDKINDLTLLNKYLDLLIENDKLKAENRKLKKQLVLRRRVEQMLQYLTTAASNNIKIIILTRPIEDYREKDRPVLKHTLAILKDEGVNILFKSNIHQKFAVIDERIVWYGSINLLSFGNAEESIMRLESSNIANELMKSIDI